MRAPHKLVLDDVRARVDARRGCQDGRWYWRAVHYVKGKEWPVWSGWGTRDEARAAIVAAMSDGTYVDASRERERPRPASDGTVDTLLSQWSAAMDERTDLAPATQKAYESSCNRLVGVLAGVLTSRLGARDLDRYRDHRLAQGRSTVTIHRDLVVLRIAWTWGRSRGWCPDRDLPETAITVRNKQAKYTPTRAEVLAILEQLDGWRALAWRMLYATGARIGDLADLTWRDVDLDERMLRVPDDNDDGYRAVPIDEIVEHLRPLRGLPDARIWPVGRRAFCELSRVLNGCERRQKGRRTYRQLGVVERLGLPRITPHALRRFAVDELVRGGVDVFTACAIVGHSVEVMGKHYRTVTAADKRAALQRARLGVVPGGKVLGIKREDDDGSP